MDLYFIGDPAAAPWSDPNMWSDSSGGAVGFGPPGPGDKAIFDLNSLYGCEVDVDVDVAEVVVDAASAGFAGAKNPATFKCGIFTSAGLINCEYMEMEIGTFNLTGGTMVMPTVTYAANAKLKITGDADFNGTVYFPYAGDSIIEFAKGSGTQQFNTRGKTFRNIKLTGDTTLMQVGDLICDELILDAAVSSVWDTDTYNMAVGTDGIVLTLGLLLLRNGTHTCGGDFSITGGEMRSSAGGLSVARDFLIGAATPTGSIDLGSGTYEVGRHFNYNSNPWPVLAANTATFKLTGNGTVYMGTGAGKSFGGFHILRVAEAGKTTTFDCPAQGSSFTANSVQSGTGTITGSNTWASEFSLTGNVTAGVPPLDLDAGVTVTTVKLQASAGSGVNGTHTINLPTTTGVTVVLTSYTPTADLIFQAGRNCTVGFLYLLGAGGGGSFPCYFDVNGKTVTVTNDFATTSGGSFLGGGLRVLTGTLNVGRDLLLGGFTAFSAAAQRMVDLGAAGVIDVDRHVVFSSSGSALDSDIDGTMKVGGNWTSSGKTGEVFSGGSAGTVEFDGAALQTITTLDTEEFPEVVFSTPAPVAFATSMTFDTLTLGASKTHTFQAGETFGVITELGTLGTVANPSVMVSSTPGLQYELDLDLAGVSLLADAADITDCDASPGLLIAAVDSIDGGNNLNIDFGVIPAPGAVQELSVMDPTMTFNIMRGSTGTAYPVGGDVTFDANYIGVAIELAVIDITNPAAPIVLPDLIPLGLFDFVAGVPRTMASLAGGPLSFTPPNDGDFVLVLNVAPSGATASEVFAYFTTQPIGPTPPIPPAPPAGGIPATRDYPDNHSVPYQAFTLVPKMMAMFNQTGDWGLKVNEPTYPQNMFFVNSLSGLPALGQTVEFRAAIPAGPYTFRVWAPKGPDCGIVDLYINDFPVATGVDLYAAALDPNNVITVPNVLLGNGIQRVKITVAGKNVASSNFFFRMVNMQLVPYQYGTL